VVGQSLTWNYHYSNKTNGRKWVQHSPSSVFGKWRVQLDRWRKGCCPPPMIHLVVGFVNNFQYRWVEGMPPHLKGQTPAPVVLPNQVESCKVGSLNWITDGFTMEEVPWCFIP
jgi:hypothetical protein